MASFPGWTWEYIDEHMTLPRLYAINKHQEKFEPMYVGVHRLVHGFLERK